MVKFPIWHEKLNMIFNNITFLEINLPVSTDWKCYGFFLHRALVSHDLDYSFLSPFCVLCQIQTCTIFIKEFARATVKRKFVERFCLKLVNSRQRSLGYNLHNWNCVAPENKVECRLVDLFSSLKASIWA